MISYNPTNHSISTIWGLIWEIEESMDSSVIFLCSGTPFWLHHFIISWFHDIKLSCHSINLKIWAIWGQIREIEVSTEPWMKLWHGLKPFTIFYWQEKHFFSLSKFREMDACLLKCFQQTWWIAFFLHMGFSQYAQVQYC